MKYCKLLDYQYFFISWLQEIAGPGSIEMLIVQQKKLYEAILVMTSSVPEGTNLKGSQLVLVLCKNR